MTPGQTLARSFESCRLTAYQDDRGIWTIGWGHTGKDVYPGLVWTQGEADEAFEHDWAAAQILLASYSPGLALVSAPAGLEEALTDFVFNLGIGNYRTSTLCKLVNAGDWSVSTLEPAIVEWDHSGDHVDRGLLRRREAELALIQA